MEKGKTKIQGDSKPRLLELRFKTLLEPLCCLRASEGALKNECKIHCKILCNTTTILVDILNNPTLNKFYKQRIRETIEPRIEQPEMKNPSRKSNLLVYVGQ
jgi:hypothetical protein